MKKPFLFSFLLIFLTVSSCSAGKDDADALHGELSALTQAEYTVKITASFPERVAEFVINYSHSPDEDRANILLPKEIAGVSYSVNDSGASLEFDGTILEVGKLPDSSLSPLSCTGKLINQWKTGKLDEVSSSPMFGKPAYLVISRNAEDDKEIEYRTWFSKDDLSPLYAEIFSNGNRFIQCEFERSTKDSK